MTNKHPKEFIPKTSRHKNSSVECPKCGSKPGDRCTTVHGRSFVAECDAHKERVHLASLSESKQDKRMSGTNSKYARIECPKCLAIIGERCRNKNMVYFQDGTFHNVRINRILAEEEKRKEQERLQAERRARELAVGDPRAQHFLRRYRALCEETGMAFGHEDGHGSFLLRDTSLPYLINWAEAATIKLKDIQTAEKIELIAEYEYEVELDRIRGLMGQFDRDELQQMRRDLLDIQLSRENEEATNDSIKAAWLELFKQQCVKFLLSYGSHLSVMLPDADEANRRADQAVNARVVQPEFSTKTDKEVDSSFDDSDWSTGKMLDH